MNPRYVPYPQPLRTCPGLAIWRQYSGQDYLVFVDESFSRFFELDALGYFCLGVVGIPASEYEAFKRDVEPVFQRYRALLVPSHTEFKHREFRRIPHPVRKQLAAALHDVLRERGGFVQGFYTPSESFVLEGVREKVMDSLACVPSDYRSLRAEVVAEFQNRRNGPGQADVISRLALQPLGGLAHMMAALDCRFRMFFDPRERREDRSIRDYLNGWAGRLKNAWPETEGRCLSIAFTNSSESEFGIQLADLIAGETRDFLQSNSDVLSRGSTPQIITQASREPIMAVQEMEGKLWKWGVITKTPNILQSRFFQDDPKQRSVLSQFTDLFAAGSLACYGKWGTPRWLMCYERLILDQTDR